MKPSAAAEWRRFRARASKTPYGADDAGLNGPPGPLTATVGPGKPVICRYNCDGAGDTIEIVLPDGTSRCPGEVSNPLKWREIKRFPRRS